MVVPMVLIFGLQIRTNESHLHLQILLEILDISYICTVLILLILDQLPNLLELGLILAIVLVFISLFFLPDDHDVWEQQGIAEIFLCEQFFNFIYKLYFLLVAVNDTVLGNLLIWFWY